MFLNHVYPSHLDSCLEGNGQVPLFQAETMSPETAAEEWRRRQVWVDWLARVSDERPMGPRIVFEWVENVVMPDDQDSLTRGLLNAPIWDVMEDYVVGSVTGKLRLPDGREVDLTEETVSVRKGDVLACQIRREIWPEW